MTRQELIEHWKGELTDVKNSFYENDGKPDILTCNISATEASRLIQCINDLIEVEDRHV